VQKKSFPKDAGEWERYIESLIDKRCDFDILLKDEWRHRIVVRDDIRSSAETVQQGFVYAGESYGAFQRLAAGRDAGFCRAVALTVFHRALAAYGDGTQTVLACLECDVGRGGIDKKVQPSVVDHAAQGGFTCLEAVEKIAFGLRRASAYADAAGLLHRGIFDAVLIFRNDEFFPTFPSIPLTLFVHNDAADRRFAFTLSYAADLFEYRVITGVLDVMRQILDEIVRGPDKPMRDLELISGEQKRQLDIWNATDGDFPSDARLESLFEDAVRRSPNEIAIVFEEERLTYKEFNACCNRVAHWFLNSGGVEGGEEIVAFFVDRSHLTVAAITGLWKAGRAYLPIDPSYPAERVIFALRDTKARWMVANARYIRQLQDMLEAAQLDVQLIEMESLFRTANAAPTAWTENPPKHYGSSQTAYVTYTSGTTGFPKGVPKQHRMAVNSITDLTVKYNMQGPGGERVALFSAPVFEPFLRQTLIALINSHTLVVVPENITLDPIRLQAFLVHHRITYLNGTRSVLQQLDLKYCSALKRLLLVGEEMTASGLRLLRETFQGQIVNEYAFTETAFVTAIKVFPPGVMERPNRSIGRPLRNVKCYVLSQDLKQIPIGAIGELYIGGNGVAKGYLNRDDLSAERFLSNPYQTEAEKLSGTNARIYKTGDLARMLPDGELEFMGRSDFQLKLNGVRVEPGEIETRVLDFPGVRQCIVILRERLQGSREWYLVGYYVAEPGSDVQEPDLLDYLSSRLIRTMVPARMLRMERFPVNVNGKVDRGALPDIRQYRSAVSQEEMVDGDGAVIRKSDNSHLEVLRSLWGRTLGIPPDTIDARDDFFRLGGDSIACIQLLMHVWNRLRIAVTLEDFYRLKTLGHFANHLAQYVPLTEEGAQAQPEAAFAQKAGPISLSANGLQQGLMYQALKHGPHGGVYVMQSVYRYRCAIDPLRMKRAWQFAQMKYPSLRARFEWNDQARQIVEPEGVELDWRYLDVSAISDPARRELRLDEVRLQDRSEPYTLSKAGLCRVYLIKNAWDDYTLLFSCHHIIMDGWSLPILHNAVHDFYIRPMRDDAMEPGLDAAYVRAQMYLEAHRDDHRIYWSDQIARIAEQGDLSGLFREQIRYKASLVGYDTVLEHRPRRYVLARSLRHF
jgi:N-(5-amino-5-carboxypentanoyl)-L-cysteinyl-D-valine synthase